MSKRIQRLFTKTAGSYDMMNHIFSMGVDVGWRKAAAREAIPDKAHFRVVDIATGGAELAIELEMESRRRGKRAEIVGIDFNKAMLRLGRTRIEKAGASGISLKHGDALSMKFKDASFDLAVSAFALRNFDSLERFFKELRRVLKPGGKFVILEMGRPDRRADRALFNFYFGTLMRPIGYAINKEGYLWLLKSINQFDKAVIVRMLKKAGFKNVESRELFSGVGFLLIGRK